MSQSKPSQRSNNKSRVTNSKLTKKPKTNKQLEQQIIDSLLSAKIPKALRGSSPYPESMEVNHTVSLPFVLLAAGSTFAIAEFSTNDLVDPLQTLGAVNVTGFTAMADIYDLYIVKRFTLNFTVSNLETTIPVSFGFIMRDSQPTVSVTNYAQGLAALAVSPTTGVQVVGVLSGNSIYRSSPNLTIRNDAIVGSTFRYYGNPNYGGTSVTSPTDKLWCALILLSPNATLLTLGVNCTLNLTYHSHWQAKKPIVA